MRTKKKAPEMTSRQQRQFNTNNNKNTNTTTRNDNNNNNNESNNSICNNNKNSNSTTMRTSYNENDIKTPATTTIKNSYNSQSQRMCRRCMTQTIKPNTIKTMTRNDCNYCKNKDCNTMNTWEEILSIHSSKAKSDQTSKSTQEESARKLEKNYEQINFLLFDPYRVLQFLLFELNLKLKIIVPDDKYIHKILSEIQQTMKRFETISTKTAFTASNITLVPEQENRVKNSNSSCQTDNNNNNNYNLLHCENSSQTENNNDGDLIGFNGCTMNRFSMETQFKQSYEKLKENCDTLEKACAILHEEKYDIQDTLSKCHNEIAMLKTEISCLQAEMKQSITREKCTSQILEEQCKCLKDELKTLQEFLSRQTNEMTIVESLNKKLKDSTEKISSLQKSRLENDRKLILTELEKEKLMILQNYRENQMNTLKKDINEVCQIIQQQLDNLQKNDYNNDDDDGDDGNDNNNFSRKHEYTIKKRKKQNTNFPDIYSYNDNNNNDSREENPNENNNHQTISDSHQFSYKPPKKSSLKILHRGKMFDDNNRLKTSNVTEHQTNEINNKNSNNNNNSSSRFNKKSKIPCIQNQNLTKKQTKIIIESTSSSLPRSSTEDTEKKGNYKIYEYKNLTNERNIDDFDVEDGDDDDDDDGEEVNNMNVHNSQKHKSSYENKFVDKNQKILNKKYKESGLRSAFKSRTDTPRNSKKSIDDVIQSSAAKNFKKFSLNSSTDKSFYPSHNEEEEEEEEKLK